MLNGGAYVDGLSSCQQYGVRMFSWLWTKQTVPSDCCDCHPKTQHFPFETSESEMSDEQQ